MCTIKDRNGKNLAEAEEIKKRWQEYTENYTKKDLCDLDNHDGVITHLEPDPGMQSEMHLRKHHYEKGSGGDGISAELFQILKDDAV